MYISIKFGAPSIFQNCGLGTALFFMCNFLLRVFSEMKSYGQHLVQFECVFSCFGLYLNWTWSSSLCRLSTCLHLFQGSSTHLLEKQPYGISYFPISQHSKCLADIWATVRHRDGMNLPKRPHLPPEKHSNVWLSVVSVHGALTAAENGQFGTSNGC